MPNAQCPFLFLPDSESASASIPSRPTSSTLYRIILAHRPLVDGRWELGVGGWPGIFKLETRDSTLTSYGTFEHDTTLSLSLSFNLTFDLNVHSRRSPR
ncbi:hypothetical protein D9758_010554 [Tetrapyrgos nigripes]|uniref:Uncharacterized protein n=1 Tax=Tetrapyrgos nigripes TaxID=182062 RepID=A0A8H5FVR5_9AGAR|nr:hypothetical protein D9758_010554 [Tetrapyrgos nigripes]